MEVKKINLESETLGQELVQSFRDTGFAVIQNHGIDRKLLGKVYRDWRVWFEMPMKDKMRCKFDPATQAGYFPPKSEKAKDSQHGDLKEFYHWYLDKEEEHDEEGNPIPTFMLRHYLVCLAGRLLRSIDAELARTGVRPVSEHPLKLMSRNSDKTLFRILHYPPLSNFTEEEVKNCVRAAAHEDINLITLLPAATNPGLEVKDVGGKWHKIECNQGDIVVNVGDMLQEATNGYLPSTTHRVVADRNAATESRYSMPLFLHPRPEVRLSPRYTAAEYLDERLKQLGLK